VLEGLLLLDCPQSQSRLHLYSRRTDKSHLFAKCFLLSPGQDASFYDVCARLIPILRRWC
jgi:hypothetical protein